MMSSNIESNSFFKTFCLVAAGAMFGYTIVKGRMKREKPDEKHFNPNRLFKIEDRTSVLKYIRYKLKSFPPSYERKFIRIQEKEALSSTPAIKDGENEIRVMSWNILARGLCQPDETWRAPKDAYDWPNYRLWRTLEETVRFASDIICLEEADAYEEIKPYLHALGYTSIFCPKYRSPCLEQAENIGPDGCAIFYRLDKFRIVNMSCENFKDDSMNSQVYILLQLEHRKLGKRLTVVCLHLKACEEYHELRAQQIEYLLPQLKRHILDDSVNREADLRKHALIICGDFNGGPEEKFYETVVSDTGFGQLVDSYSTRGVKQPTFYAVRQIGDGEKTSVVKEEKKLDFMFFTKENLELTEILELPPSDEPLIVEHGLPNLKCSSDHLSIVSSFKFL